MNYTIYQLGNTPEGKELLFCKYDDVKDKIDKSKYAKVWESTVDESENINDTLNKIYEELNITLPTGFYGHTPSVSDVIVFENGDAYYIDVIGFKKLNTF